MPSNDMLDKRVSADAASSVDLPAHPQQVETNHVALEIDRLGEPPEVEFLKVKDALARGDVSGAHALAQRINLDNTLNVHSKRFHDFTPDERLINAEARHVAIATPQAVVSLARAVRYLIKNEIPGAFAECGVYMGGSVMVMIRTLMLCGRNDRDVYLYDTFEGLPPPDHRDVCYTGDPAEKTWQFYKRGEDGH